MSNKQSFPSAMRGPEGVRGWPSERNADAGAENEAERRKVPGVVPPWLILLSQRPVGCLIVGHGDTGLGLAGPDVRMVFA